MTGHTNHAAAVWKSGTAFEVTAGSGHAILTDGDSKTGMSPMELVLAALVGCSGADVVDILRKKRQDVTHMEIRVDGERSETHPRVYTDLQIRFVLTGRGIDSEAVRRAIELSETKYCSVSAMLRATAKFTIGFEIHEAEPLAA